MAVEGFNITFVQYPFPCDIFGSLLGLHYKTGYQKNSLTEQIPNMWGKNSSMSAAREIIKKLPKKALEPNLPNFSKFFDNFFG